MRDDIYEPISEPAQAPVANYPIVNKQSAADRHVQVQDGGQPHGEVQIATNDVSKHLNIYFNETGYSRGLPLTAASARWLRDQLNRLYP